MNPYFQKLLKSFASSSTVLCKLVQYSFIVISQNTSFKNQNTNESYAFCIEICMYIHSYIIYYCSQNNLGSNGRKCSKSRFQSQTIFWNMKSYPFISVQKNILLSEVRCFFSSRNTKTLECFKIRF